MEMTKNPYERKEECLENLGDYFRGQKDNPQKVLEEFAEEFDLDLESVFPELDDDYFEDRDQEKVDEWKQYIRLLADEAEDEFYD